VKRVRAELALFRVGSIKHPAKTRQARPLGGSIDSSVTTRRRRKRRVLVLVREDPAGAGAIHGTRGRMCGPGPRA